MVDRDLAALTADFDSRQWDWLGAIALEEALPKSALVKMLGPPRTAPSDAAMAALESWLASSIETGLIADVGPALAFSLTSSPRREPIYAMSPAHAQLTLRRLAGNGRLEEIARASGAALEARSVADLALALQAGDLVRYTRRASMPRLGERPGARSAAEGLRASICEPFDAAWLERTWGKRALEVGVRVLEQSLAHLTRCDDLRAWMTSRLPEVDEGPLRADLAHVLCQHALLRGDSNALEAPRALLSGSGAGGYANAERLVRGDLASALDRLRAFLVPDAARDPASRPPRNAAGELASCGQVGPLLGLLALSIGTEASAELAKRIVRGTESEAERDMVRSFRSLVRKLGEPDGEKHRNDFPQLPQTATAWEVLLTAASIHLRVDRPASRASWAQNLARRALGYRGAGYHWIARQTLRLARELDSAYCDREIQATGEAFELPAGEPSLWDLISPVPEWKRTLRALESASNRTPESTEKSYRVAWFVDMVDGSLNRPALQEYRADAGGWGLGQRMGIAELYERRHLLPAEDLAVLECSRETHGQRRELTPEAIEMLVGHPRVLDGARGLAAVEVVRGTCRVETEEEGGYIQLRVEPAGAALGINVVPDGEGRLTVYRVTKAMQRVIDALPHGVRIPRDQETEVVRVLGKLAQSVEVRSPHLGAERDVDANATPCMRFSPMAGAWRVQVGVRPFGERGRFFVAGEGRTSVTFSEAGQRLRSERNLGLERTLADTLIAACRTLDRDGDEIEEARAENLGDTWIFGEVPLLQLLSELRASKIACELEWPESGQLRLRGTVGSRSLHLRLRSKKGWYLATGGVRLDDVTEVALGELARAPALGGGRFLRLASGDYVEVEGRVRHVMQALRSHAPHKKGTSDITIPAAAIDTVRELVDAGEECEVDDGARQWIAKVDALAKTRDTVPTELHAELRSYQLDGFRWLGRLAEFGVGACLADDMGLGKTVQILALLVSRAERGPALVVAPTSVSSNWLREMQRFAPSLVAFEWLGKDRASELARALEAGGNGLVVIASYALLQQDATELARIEWATAVLDEAQFIKNPESLRARAAFSLVAEFRIAATGTPVENHFGDLWSIFRFINPDLLGTWRDFDRRFVKPIERDGDLGPREVLKKLIAPYVLRRRKSDVLPDLPPLTEVRHEVRLSADDALRYGLLRKQIHEKLFTSWGKKQNKIEVLAEITRLRRFCCHPRLVFPEAGPESAKIRSFLELAEELESNGHRALVFSQYVDFLSLVREQLDERGITYEYLDGSTPKASRQSRVDAFQNGAASFFLISLKAGGFGINLTAADYVVHLDPWWNPAVEAQATDRAHRIGQSRRVTVYRLITKDTIEEKIVALHSKKLALSRSLLEGTEAPAELDVDELRAMISDSGAR